jgi:hypothetical protein
MANFVKSGIRPACIELMLTIKLEDDFCLFFEQLIVNFLLLRFVAGWKLAVVFILGFLGTLNFVSFRFIANFRIVNNRLLQCRLFYEL